MTSFVIISGVLKVCASKRTLFAVVSFFLIHFFCIQTIAQQQKYGLVIHGGAGTILKKNMSPEKEAAYTEKLKEALTTGYKILDSGGTSLDAVNAVINIMEDSPLFNAGKGAVLTEKGEAELDASIMEGKTLAAGAVAGVKHIKNPINLARLVMEKSPHVMMIGDGAEEFAKQNNYELVDNKYFITEERRQQYLKIKEAQDQKHGTVGCVALDKTGNLAAGTSTGGMMMKKFGRVGDAPIIGAGTYANNNTCAVSATGHGEYFIRLGVARDISSLMEYKNYSLRQAADEVINVKLTKLGGTGGVIAIDKNGNVTMPFNTEGMYRGYYINGGEPVVKIYKD
ncbi:MAG: beta-aspartyl-peptidase [Stygiobacter sp. RIFOXYC12_FULL_38_8]|nr:MAG: beta-aspartyl-peptidase [Stygiobacter sp. GWC2_38_9]OGU85306.1 MAG: beta-aspartyl-peptidase [Stygiobacter sp. RIFOXYA12_FULL_38_9]OGV07650.1 MAG: beta-aspartyl-peptidase [Stygiobacter sp. RIFOXYB2_FULL_37_11]OGV10812.1 MAG: beta-aspartyl-peptidase [Stygiobacter sp. RIFOXYA2_FULL_38_8]OGV12653.1 MAG: beta-aspartyl-peptidase [Stygiobacter sp. RIFOXYC2_FULL_38_25]OGV26911.1 MAG: beta-aspartyl-peptidase [Stygiobacter sp. RIFOXYC12_FULL_38_8]OGV82090.1 MAG: beta-aspartyl-peptidase [Stygiob